VEETACSRSDQEKGVEGDALVSGSVQSFSSSQEIEELRWMSSGASYGQQPMLNRQKGCLLLPDTIQNYTLRKLGRI
jgi:hypothetical protein